MAAGIRNRVPYEVAIHARDLGSGKPVTNVSYWRNQVQTVAPPAYGAPIAGVGDLATFATNHLAFWEPLIVARLNANYEGIDYTIRAIIGKRYGTPILAISAVAAGSPTVVTTSSPHGLTTGRSVLITGVTTPTGVDGTWVVTRIDDTTVSLDGSTSGGAWSGSGSLQKVAGPLQFIYADKYVLPFSTNGGVAGDALPLFATASARRLSAGIGRNFRSRMSLSPMSESDGKDGTFTAGVLTAWRADWDDYCVGKPENGGTDATSKFMDQVALSKQIAVAQVSPFTSSDLFCFNVTSGTVQPNFGSLVRRKPKLTALVT